MCEKNIQLPTCVTTEERMAKVSLRYRKENGKGLPSRQCTDGTGSPPADDFGIAEGLPSHTVWSFRAGSPLLLLPFVVMLPGRRVGLP